MAALSTEITLRYSTSFLFNLTNADTPAATTINTTVRDAAIADAEAAFEEYAGVTFNQDDTRHVSVGCDGVIARLTMFGGQSRSQGAEMWDAFVLRLKALRKKGKPKTTAKNTPTPEESTSTPYFDDKKMRDYLPTSTE